MLDIITKIFNAAIVVFLLCFVSACEKLPQEVTYQEIFEDVDKVVHDHSHSARKDSYIKDEEGDPHAGLSDDPHAGLMKRDLSGFPMDLGDFPSLLWTVPQGWKEESVQGMRLATFTSLPNEDEGAIQCSIVPIMGDAGGLVPNVIRWMKQINIVTLSDQELSDFINRQEKFSTNGGWEVTVFDFTQLQKNSSPAAESLIVAVIETQHSKLFIKMTGSMEAVMGNIKQFRELVHSIRPESSNG